MTPPPAPAQHMHAHHAALVPQNAEMQYAIWAGIAIKNDMAYANPDFNAAVKYSEPIIWTASGKKRLLSMDETDVRADHTKRQRTPEMRSVVTHAAGSRASHKKGKPGRKLKHDAKKGGWLASHKGGKAAASTDKGNVMVTKSAAKMSFAGGSLGTGESYFPI